ncbi:hypothetical protein WJX75_004935 [Coccomyxa subellipsoidea]|uniref:O-fucosyltransferase family protein n=1 Tax=Coccomyxa subellipsoidea TaxID=248742 RepID=A0ABR2YMY5_9CHLO
MRSGSLDAYERGRKSGIWQGVTNASMGALEQEWDSYKATSLRGWTMPSLQDAQAKSQALASSGFTIVSSPKISASSRSKLHADKPMRAENKRKASNTVQENAAAPRKAPKVGDTPSKVQVTAKGRAWAASPSRFSQNASSSLPGPKGNSTIRNTGVGGGPALRPLGERIPRPQKAEVQGKIEAAEQKPCKRIDFLSLDHQVALLGATWDELDSIALRRIWHLQSEAQREVDLALKDLRRLKGPTVAFHVRGDDSSGDEELLFDETPVNQENDLLDTFVKTYPDVKGGTCVFAGDSHRRIDDMAAAAQKRIGCKVFKRKKFYRKSGYSQEDFNQGSSEQRCSSTMHLLADMEIMARSDYFIGSFESNLPHIIQTMRFALYLKDRRTFVDASAKHRDWYSSVREYFKEQAALQPRHPVKSSKGGKGRVPAYPKKKTKKGL